MAELIRETLVQYPSDKVTIRAYVAAPQTKERRPAIIVIQEWWGLTEHIKDVARRFAAEGYVTIAPDLYSRLGYALTTDPGEAGTLMNTLQQEDGLKDLHATVAHLKSVPEADATRIGVTGFCMGGSYALMLPCVNKDIKAAVPFYGPDSAPDHRTAPDHTKTSRQPCRSMVRCRIRTRRCNSCRLLCCTSMGRMMAGLP